VTPPQGGTRHRTARYPHRRGVTASQRRQAHIDWLKLIEVSGPFLSVPVLTAEWPDLEALDTRALERFRQEHRQWQEDPARNSAGWTGYVLGELLSWDDAIQWTGLDRLALEVPEHEATLIPSFTLADPGTGQTVLLGLVSDGSPVARIAGSDWPATPADRLAMLCRHHGIELGLATDGRRWALVWAPAKGVTTTAVFDAIAWPESAERDVVRAFISLLERRRFFVVQEQRRLPALLRQSLNNQEEITDRLGVQVRQAVELLVASFGRADAYARDRGQPGLAAVTAQEVYRGAVAVMMRILFLLFAEESGLLPADSELYARAYSVGSLAAELEQRVTDARGNEGELEHTYLAWHRLLALFTAVYRGVDHPDLDLTAHDGSLFDPDAHPWLEGRQPGQDTPGTPLAVDDRTVLHMLRAVQTVTIGGELRTVSFRTLTVEQIGYAYEGLLSYEGFRAAEVVVGLTGKEGREEEVPLAELERLAAAHPGAGALAARLVEAYRDSGIGSARALAARLSPLTGDEQAQAEARLYAIARDHDLVQRLLPYCRIIRQDLRGDPVVILPGALYVTESALRASSGTHYTPKFLAKEVAEGALEPLVYSPGPLQTADRSAWKLRTSGEILALKVADIAMGSGAFLVAACRYLAGKLIETWSAEGDPRASEHLADAETDSLLDLDATADSLVIEARRQVIEHCLYGVDVNPMAVEMAKLSLWLVSMDPRRPFTFLDDRLVCGDSLLGITSAEQLEWMHLDPREGRKLHETAVLFDWTAGVRTLLAEVAADRLGLVCIAGSDIEALNKKRQILASVQARTEALARYADLIVGAALAGTRRGNLWMTAAQTASKAATNGAIEDAVTQAREWLATDLPQGGFGREPLHWPLVFPEVFDPASLHDPGFDAIIGNPPFLGGQKLTGSLGTAYREYLVEMIGRGVRGSADLIAYFVLRAHDLLNTRGQTGLIATNTLAQGDTREVGLDQVVASGTEIRQAIKSRPWPSRGAVLEYAAIWTSRQPLDPTAERCTDGTIVARIAPSLDPASRISGRPERLEANSNIAFVGVFVLGMGFTVQPERARELINEDPSNADVLFPYLNGQDLNSRADNSASRWIINFQDWSEDRAKTYPDCYEQVVQLVKPERERNNDKRRREIWWRFTRPAPELYKAIEGLQRVVVIARVSKTVMPAIVPTGQVFSIDLNVFATDDTGFLVLLSSAPHYWWAISRASTMKGDLRYTPSDVFETLVRPDVTEEMRQIGERLALFRRELMLARQAGLTATYNLVHDQGCTDADIAGLREIHRAIDEAVVRAYGWDDLLDAGLAHGFHETRQGVRYTIGPAVRQEVLDRLLELNQEWYAAEAAAGLHTRHKRQRASRDSGDAALF
jgi:Eco57I restriction-modification methylase/MmeI, target recognition domain